MAKHSARSTHLLKFSHFDGPDGEALIKAAERLGRDGRGKGGLRGYMIFLGKEHPANFVTLLNGLLRAELGKEPKRVRRTARSQNDSSIAIGEAVKYAANALGRDGKGRDGITGYLASLMYRLPPLIVRLLGTIFQAAVIEQKSQSGPTVDEKMTELSEAGIQTVCVSLIVALTSFRASHLKRSGEFRTVCRPRRPAQNAGGSSSRRRTALSRLAAARRS
jgi:hypothetical protein